MTTLSRTMNTGLIQYVADHAIADAEELEASADSLEAIAASHRIRARVLRELHAVASPHAKPTSPTTQEEPCSDSYTPT